MKRQTSIGLVALVIAGIACNAPGSQGGAPTAAPTQAQNTAAPAATTAAPTLIPTAAPSGLVRIQFAAGATSATVEGAVAEGRQDYVLYALAGQTMTVTVTATGGPVALTILSPNSVPLLRSQLGETSWSDVLPETGDYTISVVLLSQDSVHYTLEVVIPPPAPTMCTVTVGQSLIAYTESSLTASVFGTATPGTQTAALARTNDGWIGFDPGVAQAGNEGRARLRWYSTDPANLSFSPSGCQNTLPALLSLASIENGTYHVLGFQDVTLTGGQYTNPNFSPADSGSAVHDTFMGQSRAFGDLNGDGSEDAVIVLATNTGGSGTFIELFPVLNQNGAPQPLVGYFVGDRSPVRALRIEDGLVIADVTVHDADDGFCCPSLDETWRFTLESGELVKEE